MATKQTGSKDKKPGAPAKAAPAKSAEKPAASAAKPEEQGTASTVLSALKEVVKEAAHQVAEAAENLTHKVAERAGLEAPRGADASKSAEASKGGESSKAVVTPTAARKTHSFRRKLVGQVTSNKMNKTVVVEVSRSSLDRVYKKYVKHRTKYKAHDEHNAYKVGDRVEIQEHSPISREKRFTVVRLVSRPVLE